MVRFGFGKKIAVGVFAAISAGAILLPSTSFGQIPRGSCMVSDPTGTMLNIRSRPRGPITGQLRNGEIVRIISTRRGERGKSWAMIGGRNGSDIGWVFREYVSCRN